MRFFNQFIIVFTSVILISGCGGGSKGGSREKGDQFDGNFGLKNSPLFLHQNPIITRKKNREYYFPRGKAIESVHECPSTEQSEWTASWVDTCRKISIEKQRVREYFDKKFGENSAYPHLLVPESEDIHEMSESIEEPKIVHKLRHIQTTNSETIFDSYDRVFKYHNNCLQIIRNDLCDDRWNKYTSGNNPERLLWGCEEQGSEDPFLDEYVFMKLIGDLFGAGRNSDKISPRVLSLSPPVGLRETLNEKTNFGLLKKYSDQCTSNQSSIRLLVEEKVGPNLLTCQKSPHFPKGPARVTFATKMFIRVIQSLQRIHSRGIMNPGIHFGAINFPHSSDQICFFNKPDKMILSDFSRAKFFPFEIGQIETVSPDFFVGSRVRSLSPFELSGFRSGRRDDVFRAFEVYLNILTANQLNNLYSKIEKNFNDVHWHLKRAIFAEVKKFVPMTLDEKDTSIYDQIFENFRINKKSQSQIDIEIRENSEKLRSAFDAYSGLAALRSSFGGLWDQIQIKLNEIENYLTNQLDDRKLNHPDSEPDYDWIIDRANAILQFVWLLHNQSIN